jgi:hypothetical protein
MFMMVLPVCVFAASCAEFTSGHSHQVGSGYSHHADVIGAVFSLLFEPACNGFASPPYERSKT